MQLVSNLKGAGAERATYTVRVKPGASRLADMTCDCSLRLGTEYQIACVHIVEEELVELLLPNCSLVPGLVADGVTVRTYDIQYVLTYI